jgi:hypothetical protein
MRPTLSELGEYDGTALMEFKTKKNVVYLLHKSNVCTYEMDDTPPFPINQEALDISIQRNLLTIDGERRPVTEEGADYFRKERYDGAFHRVLSLPDDVDPEKVDAAYRDGLLRITIQRREASRPRRIEIS